MSSLSPFVFDMYNSNVTLYSKGNAIFHVLRRHLMYLSYFKFKHLVVIYIFHKSIMYLRIDWLFNQKPIETYVYIYVYIYV